MRPILYVAVTFFQFLTTSIDDILKEAGTSKKDVEHALDSLQNANADLKEIIDEFGDYAANMTDVIAALAQAQIGEILCTCLPKHGKSLKFSDIENFGSKNPKTKTN